MEQVLMDLPMPTTADGHVVDVQVNLRTTNGSTLQFNHQPSINPKASDDMRVRVALVWTTDATAQVERERHDAMVTAQVQRERKEARERELRTVAEIEAAFPDGEVPEKLRKVIEKVMNDG